MSILTQLRDLQKQLGQTQASGRTAKSNYTELQSRYNTAVAAAKKYQTTLTSDYQTYQDTVTTAQSNYDTQLAKLKKAYDTQATALAPYQTAYNTAATELKKRKGVLDLATGTQEGAEAAYNTAISTATSTADTAEAKLQKAVDSARTEAGRLYGLYETKFDEVSGSRQTEATALKGAATTAQARAGELYSAYEKTYQSAAKGVQEEYEAARTLATALQKDATSYQSRAEAELKALDPAVQQEIASLYKTSQGAYQTGLTTGRQQYDTKLSGLQSAVTTATTNKTTAESDLASLQKSIDLTQARIDELSTGPYAQPMYGVVYYGPERGMVVSTDRSSKINYYDYQAGELTKKESYKPMFDAGYYGNFIRGQDLSGLLQLGLSNFKDYRTLENRIRQASGQLRGTEYGLKNLKQDVGKKQYAVYTASNALSSAESSLKDFTTANKDKEVYAMKYADTQAASALKAYEDYVDTNAPNFRSDMSLYEQTQARATEAAKTAVDLEKAGETRIAELAGSSLKTYEDYVAKTLNPAVSAYEGYTAGSDDAISKATKDLLSDYTTYRDKTLNPAVTALTDYQAGREAQITDSAADLYKSYQTSQKSYDAALADYNTYVKDTFNPAASALQGFMDTGKYQASVSAYNALAEDTGYVDRAASDVKKTYDASSQQYANLQAAYQQLEPELNTYAQQISQAAEKVTGFQRQIPGLQRSVAIDQEARKRGVRRNYRQSILTARNRRAQYS